jgi:SAM-dependent methyltransferase
MTPLPDAAPPPLDPPGRQRTIVDMELPAALLELMGETAGEPVESSSPTSPSAPAAEESGDVTVDVDVEDAPSLPPPPMVSPTAPHPPPLPSGVAERPARPLPPGFPSVVVVSPIRSIGYPPPPPMAPLLVAAETVSVRPPPPPARYSTQRGLGKVDLPDDFDDEPSVPDPTSSEGIAALVREGLDDEDLAAAAAPQVPEPAPATAADEMEPVELADEPDELSNEPTQVRRVGAVEAPVSSESTLPDLDRTRQEPAPPPPPEPGAPKRTRSGTMEIDLEDDAVADEERDSDPPTPIEVDASDEIEPRPSVADGTPPPPPLPFLVPGARPAVVQPAGVVSPLPAPALLGGAPSPRPGTPVPSAPPPVPKEVAAKGEGGPRRRRWWEDLFNDDYLRTVPRVTEAYNARECDFIEASLGLERGAKLLDIGCGTGRHSVNLAGRGYSVVGLDLSLSMLTRAQALAEESERKVNFMQADMREMTFDAAFDGIYCVGTTYGLFDDEANIQLIRTVHRALKDNGALLIEVANRDFVVRSQPNLIWFEGDACVCMEETTVNYITSRLHVKRTVILDEGGQQETEYSVRLYSLHELGTLLHKNGFRVTEVSGQYSTRGAFFGMDSPRVIILAEKRGSAEAPAFGTQPSIPVTRVEE